MKARGIIILSVVAIGGWFLYDFLKKRKESEKVLTQEEADVLADEISELRRGIGESTKEGLLKIVCLKKELADSGFRYLDGENGNGKAVKVEVASDDYNKKDMPKTAADAIVQKLYDLYVKYINRGETADGNKWVDPEKGKEFDKLESELNAGGYMVKYSDKGASAVKIASDDDTVEASPEKKEKESPKLTREAANAVAFTIMKKRRELPLMRLTKEGYSKYMQGLNALIKKLNDGGFKYAKGKAVLAV